MAPVLTHVSSLALEVSILLKLLRALPPTLSVSKRLLVDDTARKIPGVSTDASGPLIVEHVSEDFQAGACFEFRTVLTRLMDLHRGFSSWCRVWISLCHLCSRVERAS